MFFTLPLSNIHSLLPISPLILVLTREPPPNVGSCQGSIWDGTGLKWGFLSQRNEKGEQRQGWVGGMQSLNAWLGVYRLGTSVESRAFAPLHTHVVWDGSPQMNVKSLWCAHIHCGEVRALAAGRAVCACSASIRGWVWRSIHTAHPPACV